MSVSTATKKDKKTIESMLDWCVRNKPHLSVVTTMLNEQQLRGIGAQHFNGKWTYQINHAGSWKTFELVPKK